MGEHYVTVQPGPEEVRNGMDVHFFVSFVPHIHPYVLFPAIHFIFLAPSLLLHPLLTLLLVLFLPSLLHPYSLFSSNSLLIFWLIPNLSRLFLLFLLLQVRLLYCSLEEAELIFKAAWAAGQAGPSHMWFAVGPALSGLGLEGLPKALFAIRPQGWRDEPRR